MASVPNTHNAAREQLRYTRVAIVLHWAIAAFILYNLLSGLLRDSLPKGFFQFHVSSGITILVLSVVRVVWRLTHRPPALLPMAQWERSLSKVVHFLIYTAILVVPFSGWAMVSASPPMGSAGAAWAEAHRPGGPAPVTMSVPAPAAVKAAAVPPRARGPMVWGILPLPTIAPIKEIGRSADGASQQRALRDQLGTFHVIGAWMMLILLLLHVAGALKHQFVDRQRELARMGLGRAAQDDSKTR